MKTNVSSGSPVTFSDVMNTPGTVALIVLPKSVLEIYTSHGPHVKHNNIDSCEILNLAHANL